MKRAILLLPTLLILTIVLCAARQSLADDTSLPKVLIIGDSISMGYTRPVQDTLAGKADVRRIPTNGGPTSRGVESIDSWLGEEKWNVIHFNWGLHDLKYIGDARQVPPDQYKENLTKLVARMKQTGAKLIWCSTTPYPEGCSPRRDPPDAVLYNEIAEKIMKENDVAINDLYTFALPKLKEIQQPVNVHFTATGSKVLGDEVARVILAALGEK